MKGRDALGLVAVGAIVALAGAKVVDGFPGFVDGKPQACIGGRRPLCNGQRVTADGDVSDRRGPLHLTAVVCLEGKDYSNHILAPLEALEHPCANGNYKAWMQQE